METLNVLVLDDEPGIRQEIHEFLISKHMDVKEAASPSEAFNLLSSSPVDIAILDIRLPEMSGIEVLRQVKRSYPGTEVIMMSGHGDMDSVIDALRLGAVDYFKKPFRLQEMMESIEKTSRFISVGRLLRDDHFHYILPEIFGRESASTLFALSPAMKKVVEQMRQVAASDETTVLITGESGSGKELIARGIHHLSQRRTQPFFAVNCSSVPDELFESEFFGYKKGAFTGAYTDKPGWFEAANHGVLFLDEIGDMKTNLQAKLLRVLDERRITRLGSTQGINVDVRLVAATNQNLEKLQAEGRFRHDLFHRLNTFVIHVPPLRERPVAIPPLLGHFLEYYSKKLNKHITRIDNEVIEMLMRYDFPGNVRELKHMVERAVILCNDRTLDITHFDHLKEKMSRSAGAGTANPNHLELDRMEKDSIIKALQHSGYNKTKAARLLNISRQSLDRKIEKYGLSFNRGNFRPLG